MKVLSSYIPMSFTFTSHPFLFSPLFSSYDVGWPQKFAKKYILNRGWGGTERKTWEKREGEVRRGGYPKEEGGRGRG